MREAVASTLDIVQSDLQPPTVVSDWILNIRTFICTLMKQVDDDSKSLCELITQLHAKKYCTNIQFSLLERLEIDSFELNPCIKISTDVTHKLFRLLRALIQLHT